MEISKVYPRKHLRTRVIKKIEEIPPAQFNKIFPPVPEGHGFFKTLDESGFDQFTFYYILVYRKKELAGVAPCFLVNYSLDTSVSGPLRRVSNAVKKIFPSIFSVKALVCGVPMGQGQLGLSQRSCDAHQDSEPHGIDVLEAVERRMGSLARKLKAPLTAFKDFEGSYDKLFLTLLKKSYFKIDSLPMTRLKLDFSDFEEYLKKTSSATRYDLRRKLKKASGVQMELSITSALDEAELKEAYQLYLQAVETHDMGFEIVPENFFRRISINMPHESKFFLWRIKGKLAAFVFCLVTQDVLLDYYLGLDYTLGRENHLYFVKFKEVTSWCLAHGIKTYEMGATGYEPKRRLKFDFIPVYIYVKIRYKILRPFLKLLCFVLKFENFDPELKRWQK